eukprot:1455219-Rhodomonas_salina.1
MSAPATHLPGPSAPQLERHRTRPSVPHAHAHPRPSAQDAARTPRQLHTCTLNRPSPPQTETPVNTRSCKHGPRGRVEDGDSLRQG